MWNQTAIKITINDVEKNNLRVCFRAQSKLVHFSISCCAFLVYSTLKGFEIKLKPYDEFFTPVRGELTFNSENASVFPFNGRLYP